MRNPSLHDQDPVAYFTRFFSSPASSSDYPCKYDFILIPVFAILLTLIRLVAERILHRIGCFLISVNQPEFPLKKPEEYAMKMIKFREQAFKMTYHGFIGLVALVLFGGSEWWANPDICQLTDASTIKFTPLFKLYYLLQTGFHLHSLVYHYIERTNHKRDDDIQMQVHHFATMFLTIGSFHLGFLKVGTLVLYTHDISDVFIALTKIANYTKFSDPTLAVLLTSVVFSWAYYRLYRFPKDVILNVWEHFDLPNGGLFLKSLNWVAFVLLILHWIWFYQIIQIPLAMVAGNKEYDTTENWKEATKQKEGSKKGASAGKKGKSQHAKSAHIKQQ